MVVVLFYTVVFFPRVAPVLVIFVYIFGLHGIKVLGFLYILQLATIKLSKSRYLNYYIILGKKWRSYSLILIVRNPNVLKILAETLFILHSLKAIEKI